MLKPTPIVISLVVVLFGVIVFQARRISELSATKPAPTVAAPSVSTSSAVDSRERERLGGELAATRREIERLRQMAEPKVAPADGIAGRGAALKETLQRLPEQQIPQLAYTTEADWYAAVEGPLETAEDFRMAMARLRNSAYSRFWQAAPAGTQGIHEGQRRSVSAGGAAGAAVLYCGGGAGGVAEFAGGPGQ